MWGFKPTIPRLRGNVFVESVLFWHYLKKIQYQQLRNFCSSHLCVWITPGLCILLCEESVQLAWGISVVLLFYMLALEIIHGGAPEVFLHRWKLECRHITALVRWKTQTQKENSKLIIILYFENVFFMFFKLIIS